MRLIAQRCLYGVDRNPMAVDLVVSVVWVVKGESATDCSLDGRNVPLITAYLFHAGGHENPTVLQENAGKSYIGCYLLGMGFTFDDTDKTGIATPLAVMQELIAKEPRNAIRIFPYLGGEEVNDNPKHEHHRFVINFADFPVRRDELGASWIHADQQQRQAWQRSGIVPLALRDLHARMDAAVPAAYGWTDLPTTCEFLLDYEEEDDPPSPGGFGAASENEGKVRRRKKPCSWSRRLRRQGSHTGRLNRP
jgi:hypothetical protein